MAEAMILVGFEWVAFPVISKLVKDSISYLGSNIAKDLKELEETLLPEFQLTIEAAQNSTPDDKDRLAKWLARLKNAYFDAEAILHDLEYNRLKRKAKGEDKKLLVRFSSKPIIKPLVQKVSMLSPQKRELLQRLNNLKQVAAEAKNFRDLLGIHNTGSKFPDIISSFLTDKVAAEVQTFGFFSGIQSTKNKDGIVAGNNHYVTSMLPNDLLKDLENLETTLLPQFHLTIQAAKHRPPCDVAPLASWLARLMSACDDAEAILYEVKRKTRGVATRSSTSVLVKKSSQKLVQQLNNLKQIAVEAKTFRDLLGIADNSPSITSPFFTDKVFGRDRDRDDIINFLLDDKDCSSLRKNYSVVVITGMGGVGKTTLAQYVYNDPKVKNYFNLRMWLCLSRNFDINKVTKEMIECASEKECPNIRSLGFLQHMLTKILPKSSNIMVVLDDVWYDNHITRIGEQQWRNLLAPFASRGGTCKIVVTTRSTSFPMALLPEKLIKLNNLSPDDFKSLLRYCVIDSLQISNPPLKKDSSSDLRKRIEIVDEIAEKMSKQPLAAKVLGNELCAWQDIKFWQETREKFKLSTDVVVGNRCFSTSSLVTNKVFGHDEDCDEIINFATSPLLTSNVFGRDGVRDEIISFLLNKQQGSTLRKSYSVVAIIGTRGVGKTTLAQYIFNDERIKKHFGVRMWLCLSQNFDINEVIKEMIEWASGKECPNLQNLTELQNKLIETLSESDNIMVILDDVWYDNYDRDTREKQWDSLLTPFDSRGGTCKIVVTSRSTSFPMAVNPDKLIKLRDVAPCEIMKQVAEQTSKMSKQLLAAKAVGNHSITSSLRTDAFDEFISLLRYHAFDGLQIKDPQLMNDLSDIVNHIAIKMSKSPLAAKVVGNQLCKMPEIGFWLATLYNVDLSDIMEILQWSFHRFDMQLQRCFLFCGVFPKGTRYSLHQLVHYWVALGLIQPTDDNKNVEDVGLKYFEKMEANSVFYQVDERYIMHELFHRLAQELSAKDCFRETSAEEKIPSSVQHVYLKVNNENLKENLSSICNLSNLRTLILVNPFIDDISEIISKKSTDFRNLRILHVESRGNKTLPRGVGDFKSIQLLNFAKSSIEELPDSISQLYHLQFLLLPSSVETLPKKLSNLMKLRCIEMYNDDGHQVNTLPPVPYLGKLTSLQCLDEFHVKDKEGYELQQLGSLKEIGGSLRIVDLQNVRDKDKAVKASLIEKPKLKKLDLVWVDPGENNSSQIEVIEALQPPAKLESLTINGYMGSTYPTWLQEGSLVENLKDVGLYNCNALTFLPYFHRFRDCSELILKNLEALRDLSYFPENLARLSIIKCPCLVFVCENELQVSENQSTLQFLIHGVEGCKDILEHELKSFKQTGSVENCEEQLKVIENFVQNNKPHPLVNVDRAWWFCHQQRMNFIFGCNTRANKLKLPFMLHFLNLRFLNLSYCCVSDEALSNCLKGMTTLEELHLEGIMTITTLPPEENLESLWNLRVLRIIHCWYLRSLGGLHALPHLQRFRVQSCWCLEMNSIALNGFPTLEFIDIIDCPESISIKSFRNFQGRAAQR